MWLIVEDAMVNTTQVGTFRIVSPGPFDADGKYVLSAVVGGVACPLLCDKDRAVVRVLLDNIETLIRQKANGFEDRDVVDLRRDVAEIRGLDRIPHTSIEECGFSSRTFRCLSRHGISTLREAAMLDDEELLGIRNFGHTSLAEVKAVIAAAVN